MSKALTLNAEKRPHSGTGAARAQRRVGKVPAVIYGGGKDVENICLDPVEVTKAYHRGDFLSALVNVEMEGKPLQVIPKEIQTHPVKGQIMHVDFLRVGKNTLVTVDVPVHFSNEEESPGLKRGGMLNIVRHDVELKCPATDIPAELKVDLTGLDIGDSVKISAIDLPKGAVPTITDRDFTIATIAAPTLMAEEEEGAEVTGEEGAAAEGEDTTEGDTSSE